ncbi:Hemocytin, partial [Stegodyphus mimosarum]
MVEELCQDIPQVSDLTEEEKPCEKYPKRREIAAEVCDFMRGPEFSDCHPLIDYTRYYSNCMEDVCDCEIEPEFCACLSLSNYAAACAKKGKPLSWRQAFPPCGISCPMGQMYLSCANPCSYSCSEIANSYSDCKDNCVEGCMCPPGETLNAHGTCVPVSTCSCVHSGHAYPPDYLQRRGKEMCACSQGHWDCHEATTADILLTPPPHVAPDCNVSAGMEPTECVTECPLTCSNYHHHQPCAVSVCVPGCRCKKGYVLDTTSNVCVKPQNCPCHHSGRSYEEGAQVNMDCNTCVCEGGSWNCDSNPCPGLCSAWGDSHFETFDGRLFDFDGICDYVMVKAHVSDSVIFSVVIENVPCGIGGGAKCGKAVSITLGSSNVILTREHPLPVVSETSGFTVSSAGMFTLVNTDIGITVQWDRNTRVYVIAQPMWEGKLQGLCGDFNSDASDDFRPPSGGIPLVLAKDFADSWRVHKYCKPAKQPKDACEENPERRSWSRQKCIVLKSDLFKPCHHQVEVEEYYKRCVFDTCACNAGGDCECLCAVIAAYAQKCAHRGIAIPWRSQELCPIQCEACDRYSPCISLCPPPNCDTYLDSPEMHTCNREPCVEGCEPKPCEAGQVHKSATNITCVPEQFCREKPCAVIKDVPYREGERIESEDVGDACQSCYCRHGAVECVGVPCTEAIITTTRAYIVEVMDQCKFTGWTDWFNSVDPSTNAGRDFEKLGKLADDLRLPCPITHVKSVQCRDANTLVPVDATNEQVTCDLETGLECNTGNCLDYEMRAYCQCQEEVTCPPGQEWNACAFDCENSCQALQEDLKQQGLCNNGEKCAPGCSANVCKLPYLARDPKTCVFPETCTCKLSTGFVLAPGQVVTSGCEKCQCLNNTLICSTTHDCKVQEVTTLPPGVTGTAVGLPYTPPTLLCKDGWTSWLNTHLPDRDGDTELLVDLIDKGLVPCSLEDIKEISCRNAKDPEIEMQAGVFCDLKAGGLVCRNRDMIKPSRCSDYEMRVFCSCAEIPEVAITTTETTLPVTETTKISKVTSPSFKLVTFKGAKPQRGKRPHLVGNLGFIMTTPACSAWSAWINKSRPKKGKKYGEREDTRHYILKQTEGFCSEGTIIAIECRDVKSDMDYTETKEEKLVCDLNKGFICLNRNQPDGRCQDYKIRYLCSCEEATTPPSLFIKTTTPAYIYPCVDFVPLIDGEKPLPDSNIKASTSASSSTGPDAARMKAEIGKAWTASVEDQKQFIEVNLDDVRAIYGVITKGKPLSNEWVTSYQLLFSNDGVSYSYYQDESDNNKVFSANFDDQNEVKHILSRPFEAKYVRLEPLTWEKKISLRLELLGCSEAVSGITEPTVPFTELVKPLEGCTTPIGMENRSFPDSRLTASSEYDSGHSAKYGRLGSDTAWVAADLDSDQYFQINFQKKANISGVKTKGRQDSSEWVTSYIIAYSDDGVTWEKITDENGIPKEFLANTDQYTTVTNMLPNVLITKYLRIIPTKWEKWISMQVEILACTPAEMEKLIALKPPSLPRPRVRPGVAVPVFGLTVKECTKPMGLQNGLLLDSQLSATSSYSSRFTPDFARMGSDSVWAAANLKDRQYLQVDFLDEQNVTGIITKGREDIPQWVTAYTVSYSNDGIVWNPIKGDDGTKKEFSANYDPFALVTNNFPTMIRTRFLRIEPTKWKNWISMQIEILGCYHPLPCHDPMGIENGLITDHQLYASSSISDDMLPAKSRLSSATAWSPAKYDQKHFIAVDFLEPTNLTGVTTKGNPNAQEWVISYHVSYSNDSLRWLKVQNPDGKIKEFLGNNDQDSAVTNLFSLPVIARYLSIHPIKFHRWTSLRLEVLGCYHEQVCREPMGLENGVLADAQISASSSANPDTTPDHVRINDESGWEPRTLDAKPYLQVDFLEPREVSAVVTKGMKDTDYWVTKFKVIYSQDGDSWQPVVDESANVLEFPANKDRDTPVVNVFPETIESRYFRIIPLDYHDAVGLRLELLGCYHPYECQEPLGMESGSIYDFQLSASSYSSPTLSPSNARMDSDTAWVAAKDDENPFIQVDLLTFINVTGIMTQGRNDANEWVTAYRLEYSDDGQDWISVDDNSSNAMEFKGNFDNESPVTNMFPYPIFTRFLKIKPTQSKSS